ncbi:SH3 domain-containing protein, partial [Escherichia coli]|nr:SH3 domain-containing protein [Escherichia coli]
NQHVNLRAGPADGSRVITVVPAGATVQAQANCRWCVATYNGQRGYIFVSFLRGKAPTASAEPAVKAPSSKPGLY